MIPIHHMAAHATTVRMETDVKFPYMVLLISGGHCILAIAKDVDDFVILGASTDDSPGETLDKVARRLKVHTLPDMRDISGGRAVEILAKGQDPSKISFGVPKRADRDCNFSFSGLKGHLDNHLNRMQRSDGEKVSIIQTQEICAGVQHALTKHLCERLQRGIEYVEYDGLMDKEGTLVVSGGVASNHYIRKAIEKVCYGCGWRAVFPQPKLCTDNGVMIAWNGLEFWRLQRNIVKCEDVFSVQVHARSPLGEDISDSVKQANLKCKWIKI